MWSIRTLELIIANVVDTDRHDAGVSSINLEHATISHKQRDARRMTMTFSRSATIILSLQSTLIFFNVGISSAKIRGKRLVGEQIDSSITSTKNSPSWNLGFFRGDDSTKTEDGLVLPSKCIDDPTGPGCSSRRNTEVEAPAPSPSSYLSDFPYGDIVTAAPTKDMCYGNMAKLREYKKFCNSEMPSVSLEPSEQPTAFPSSSEHPTAFPSSGPSQIPSLPPSVLPSAAPTQLPTAENFCLQMYWQVGYLWQGETFEREWCIGCAGKCRRGDTLFLQECGWDVVRFEFVYLNSDQVQIKVGGTDPDLCLERSDNEITLQICDSSKVRQRWTASKGSFTGNRFEMSQSFDGSTFCLTTHHHPKFGEEIELYNCRVARKDTTSLWKKC